MKLFDALYWKAYNAVTLKLAEEDGINTIEVVVILIALLAVAIIFRSKIMELFNTWWGQVQTS